MDVNIDTPDMASAIKTMHNFADALSIQNKMHLIVKADLSPMGMIVGPMLRETLWAEIFNAIQERGEG